VQFGERISMLVAPACQILDRRGKPRVRIATTDGGSLKIKAKRKRFPWRHPRYGRVSGRKVDYLKSQNSQLSTTFF
jgi:hypothetical protein